MSLLSRIEALQGQGKRPIALLDIDLTLLENEPRTREILRRFVASLPLDLIDSEQARTQALARASELPLVFSIKRNLAAVLALPEGRPIEPFVRHGLALWRSLFFGNELLSLDTPLDGALEAVQRLVKAHVLVVYVTARPVSMAQATAEALAALGFPTQAPEAQLVTKEDERLSDRDFKVAALEACRALGEVVLTAENEPAHANAFALAFPEARHVLVDTRHSEDAPPLLAQVHRLPRLLDVFAQP